MSWLHELADKDLAEVFDVDEHSFEKFTDYGPGDLRDAWILGYYAGKLKASDVDSLAELGIWE